MIPKIIHYCWFGRGLMPKSQKDCIKSWQKLMPDYKIMRWDESNFDINKYSATKYGHQVKKYALVANVCRSNVLYEYGGIYLDTDVEVFKRFDDFLGANFFSAIELYNEFYKESQHLIDENGNAKKQGEYIKHLEILTSLMGCVPGNELIGDVRKHYNNLDVDKEWAANYKEHLSNDRLVATCATKYGFKYKDEKQLLDNNMIIYPTGIFGYAYSPNPKFEVTYHYNAATWKNDLSKEKKRQMFFDKLYLLGVYKKIKALKKKYLK